MLMLNPVMNEINATSQFNPAMTDEDVNIINAFLSHVTKQQTNRQNASAQH
jgi:hypothetical protein